MMRWLQWGADEAFSEGTSSKNLIAWRLGKLEKASEAAQGDTQKWGAAIASKFSMRADANVQWPTDPKLLEFFQKEISLPESERLSRAALGGFW